MTQLSYTIDEVSSICSIGRTKIYEAINKGSLSAKKFGSKTLILSGDLDDFLSNLESFPSKKEEK